MKLTDLWNWEPFQNCLLYIIHPVYAEQFLISSKQYLFKEVIYFIRIVNIFKNVGKHLIVTQIRF
jgi:hypothetical protein